MKLNDAVWGALLALLGAAILWHVQGFPRIPGQNVGPALFPGILAAAMLVCGAILIVSGMRARREVVPSEAKDLFMKLARRHPERSEGSPS